MKTNPTFGTLVFAGLGSLVFTAGLITHMDGLVDIGEIMLTTAATAFAFRILAKIADRLRPEQKPVEHFTGRIRVRSAPADLSDGFGYDRENGQFTGRIINQNYKENNNMSKAITGGSVAVAVLGIAALAFGQAFHIDALTIGGVAGLVAGVATFMMKKWVEQIEKHNTTKTDKGFMAVALLGAVAVIVGGVLNIPDAYAVGGTLAVIGLAVPYLRSLDKDDDWAPREEENLMGEFHKDAPMMPAKPDRRVPAPPPPLPPRIKVRARAHSPDRPLPLRPDMRLPARPPQKQSDLSSPLPAVPQKKLAGGGVRIQRDRANALTERRKSF